MRSPHVTPWLRGSLRRWYGKLPWHSKSIEVSVSYKGDNEYPAKVAVGYLEYALEDAFGDACEIDVWMGDRVPSDLGYQDEWLEYTRNDLDPRASDCNHLLGGPDAGGGTTSTGGDPGPLRELDPENVKRIGHGDRHFSANMVIHEVGHALGMGHKTDVSYPPVRPMATSYVDSTPYIHEYHPKSIAESDYA